MYFQASLSYRSYKRDRDLAFLIYLLATSSDDIRQGTAAEITRLPQVPQGGGSRGGLSMDLPSVDFPIMGHGPLISSLPLERPTVTKQIKEHQTLEIPRRYYNHMSFAQNEARLQKDIDALKVNDNSFEVQSYRALIRNLLSPVNAGGAIPSVLP
ncbi:unnamed protein product [Penicillium bialowiezense]